MAVVADILTRLEFPVEIHRDAHHHEIVRLHKQYMELDAARKAFIASKITFEEYIEFCEQYDFDIDEYLKIIEQNLDFFKLI